jgi:hypothetical protein
MSCPYTSPSPKPLPLNRFRALHPDGRHLIGQWFDRANQEHERTDGSVFEAFIFLWFSFNGFASCITDLDRDAEIIRKVGNCPSLREQFLQLRANDPEFDAAVLSFGESWPIFKVQDLRRRRLLHSGLTERPQLIQHYLGGEAVSHEPCCFLYHRDRNEAVPLDWPHTLQATYRVRCNLFHGEKSPTSEMDQRIVVQAFTVLSRFLAHTEILP